MKQRQRHRNYFGHVPYTYVAEVLHVAHEVTFGVDDLVYCLLTLLLSVRDARDDLRRDGVDPERAGFL